jgi:hypothetical protein
MNEYILEGHKNPDKIVIGTIDFNDTINEQQIQANTRFNPKSIGECTIEVYSGEGSIPHFHIYSKDKKFSSCIRIYENFYFSHGGKYRDTFNSKQCRELNNYLKRDYPKGPVKMTVWEAIVFSWNFINPECLYPEKKKINKQPHYENLSMFKDVM